MNAVQSKGFVAGLKSLGPYLLIELILPGGTLIALLLWLSQGMRRGTRGVVHKPALLWPAAIARVVTPRRPLRHADDRRCCALSGRVSRVLQRARALLGSGCACETLQCATR